MANKRILAIGAGATKDSHIQLKTDASNDINVRWYVDGLIDGLAASFNIGTDYDIWYRHRANFHDDSFDPNKGGDGTPNDVIFPMSLQVAAAAINYTNKIRAPGKIPTIVFPSVSDPTKLPIADHSNVAGIDAQRSQSAGACFTAFLETLPALQTATIDLLHCDTYQPSIDAFANIVATMNQPEFPFPDADINPVLVTQATLLEILPTLRPAGLMVLPVDFCFAAAADIIDIVQQANGVPTFFPIPDWVQPKGAQAPALGGYGVTQYSCGSSVAGLVAQIWNKTATAAELAVRLDESVVWYASQNAVEFLGVELPDDIPPGLQLKA